MSKIKNKKRVVILGATGMLGNAVYSVLKDKYNLVLTSRSLDKIKLLEKTHGKIKNHKVLKFDLLHIYNDYLNKNGHPGTYLSNFLKQIGEIDYIINAIGITIPYSLENQTLTFFINGNLPHILSNFLGYRLIHVTTDCVYNGKEGFPYDENSPKTPIDIYGLSKSLGEPTNCLTIRTSIIGRELEGFTGLLEWFLQQKNREINGFTQHFWNGITTKEFGKICDKIMVNPNKYPKTGIFHVYSSTVSKYEMLKKFEEKYKINCSIRPEKKNKLNRTLNSIHRFNSLLNIAPFDKMLDEL